MPPASFLESNFRTKAEYEASLLLSEADREAAEAAAAANHDQLLAALAAAATPEIDEPTCTPCEPSKPTACIVIGMAGAGKTTLMQRLNAHLHDEGDPYYMVNLDPAVLDTPFGPHVDIRDTVNYKEVMKQYQLGPNGGILTSLNLFATRFDQVIGLMEKRNEREGLKYALFDTPGQIEIFTWSASGQIITESLAATYPTVIVYVVDTVRCKNAVTFMSNMLYACSILYKLKLPLVLALNKVHATPPVTPVPHARTTTPPSTPLVLPVALTVAVPLARAPPIRQVDAEPCNYALEWMDDLDAFQEALQAEKSYMGSLAQSMALMLEEFYKSLKAVGVSAITGAGMTEFFRAVDDAAKDYTSTYAVELQKQREKKEKREQKRQAEMLAKLEQDHGGLEAAGAKVVMGGEKRPGAELAAGSSSSSGGGIGDTSRSNAADVLARSKAAAERDRAGGPFLRSGGAGSDDEGSEEGELEMYASSGEDDDEDGPFQGGAYKHSAGFTYADEQYARENPQEDKEEYESLMRYLDGKRASQQDAGADARNLTPGGRVSDAETDKLMKEQAEFMKGLQAGKRPAATSSRVDAFPTVKPSGSKPRQFP